MVEERELAVRVLEAAAHLVEAGWCQKVFRMDGEGRLGWMDPWVTQPREGDRFCLGYALEVARKAVVPVYWQSVHIAVKVRRAVEEETGAGSLVAWNDAPGRIKEEVVAALRNAKRHL